MRKLIIILITAFILSANTSIAQCSICAKTAAQMGEKPAKGLNGGILYLMAAPFVVVGVIGYRWWKSNGREA